MLVRHGESEWNQQGRIQGRTDTPLTALGAAQARAIGVCLRKSLAGEPVTILSSPLSRATETARIVAREIGAAVDAIEINQRLDDFDVGEIAGIVGWEEVARRDPELARLRLEDPFAFHPAGGESGADMDRRLRVLLDELEQRDGTLVLVSHGIVNKFIRSIRRDLHGADIIELGESQRSIYVLDGARESVIDVTDEDATEMLRTVEVELAERSYQIVVAPRLIDDAASYLRPIVNGRRLAVVSDDTVTGKFLERFAPTLDAVTDNWRSYTVKGGESAKSFAGLEALLDQMLGDGIDRSCVVLAFGGGVVGDLAGFAAALLMRGVELVQVPTTLMSQVDSAVGGKNAINTRQGKNLVGSFLQPRVVLNDVSLLQTLPPGEMRAGYGEIIKYALLRGEPWLSWLEANGQAIIDGDEARLVEVIRMGCETKAAIVSEDELDKGRRALVNLGHTFAHAFENFAGYGEMPHGTAVATGVVAACDLSERTGLAAPGLTERVRKHTESVGLPASLPSLSQAVDWRSEGIYRCMLHDKKTVNGTVNFVLVKAPGEVIVSSAPNQGQVCATLDAMGAGA
jgi:3-dehydroquinate synthase